MLPPRQIDSVGSWESKLKVCIARASIRMTGRFPLGSTFGSWHVELADGRAEIGTRRLCFWGCRVE